MIGRSALAGAAFVLLGASSAFAGSPMAFWMFQKACPEGSQSQCALQFTFGNGNKATTDQWEFKKHSHQLAVTVQKGDDNIAFTGQVGTKSWSNQGSLTIQEGDNNHAFTYQDGGNNYSKTVQDGNGTWAASSSIGVGTYTNVTVSN